MKRHNEAPEFVMTVVLTLVTAAIAILFYTIPSMFLTILAIWTLISIPIGLLVGHCALHDK